MRNTTSVVINFTIRPELLKRIEDYRFQHRLPNRAKTFKTLVKLALDQQDWLKALNKNLRAKNKELGPMTPGAMKRFAEHMRDLSDILPQEKKSKRKKETTK